MIDEYVVKHYEHVCTKSFEEVVEAFEAAVGDGDDGKFLNGMKALSRADDWERLCKASFGPSGFLHVLTFDHGHWLKLYGIDAKAKQYTYGNPLLAHTMIKHDIGVCFQVPFRILIYEARPGEVRIAYDLPSTLMARLHNDDVDEAAVQIDPKVIAFVTGLAGASA
jgi:uncharacterized protein (DUF302 family)